MSLGRRKKICGEGVSNQISRPYMGTGRATCDTDFYTGDDLMNKLVRTILATAVMANVAIADSVVEVNGVLTGAAGRTLYTFHKDAQQEQLQRRLHRGVASILG